MATTIQFPAVVTVSFADNDFCADDMIDVMYPQFAGMTAKQAAKQINERCRTTMSNLRKAGFVTEGEQFGGKYVFQGFVSAKSMKEATDFLYSLGAREVAMPTEKMIIEKSPMWDFYAA